MQLLVGGFATCRTEYSCRLVKGIVTVRSFLTTNGTLHPEKGQTLMLLAKYLPFPHCSFQMSFDFNEINRNRHVFRFHDIFF